MAKKKSIKKTRTVKEVFTVEGFMNLEKLQGFCVDLDDAGLKDISKDFLELNGKFGKITLTISEDEDLTEVGFEDKEIEE